MAVEPHGDSGVCVCVCVPCRREKKYDDVVQSSLAILPSPSLLFSLLSLLFSRACLRGLYGLRGCRSSSRLLGGLAAA